MKKIFLVFFVFYHLSSVIAQDDISPDASGVKAISGNLFVAGKKNNSTQIKNQQRTNTCWSFSATSLIESQTIKNNLGPYDLSEMFTVRNLYIEKAQNYILRQGHAQFSEGGLGHDVIRSYATYGAVPESAYSGNVKGEKLNNHLILIKQLKTYLDSTLKTQGAPLSSNWLPGFNQILDRQMGELPQTFIYNNKKFTPQTFAKNALRFNADDYINITSFTHHPFYAPFIIEVPDNFSNGSYYNLPLNEMIDLVKSAIENGYSVSWDADVSNNGFNSKTGVALNIKDNDSTMRRVTDPDSKEEKWDQNIRQQLFENLTTQDDHLMHIVGIEKSKGGKTFFIVKNSWGESGPYKGYMHVSESYFAINTISLVVPKAAVGLGLREKMGGK
ncbi:MAG: C1 family peptidase [Bacteroidota bacterium]